jgi:spore maturation protein CgeB
VLNGSIDMAGDDRGNMRCFEAMGCGALMVSDAGNYPSAMEPGVTIMTYDSPAGAVGLIEDSLSNPQAASAMAALGRKRMVETYNKSLQWQSFIDLVGGL